ncbi:MAG TPA: hypothetical protein VGB24_12135 [Longimicrobium sp.]|uniref:hypothetical protein n=1 Tax=Longimicrobium sp. TaxID=2029185 RepID=UPI002ED80829
MKVVIAVHPASSAPIVRRALGLCSSTDVCVRGVEDRSTVPSAAYWAVRDDRARAICVVDAESTNPTIAHGIQEDLWFLVSHPPYVTIHMALPEVAAVLFQSPDHLAAILDVDVTQEDRIRAEYVPGEILNALIERSPRVRSISELVEQVGTEYASRMREHPLMRDVACSLERALAAPRVPAEMDYFTEVELLPT